MPLNRLFRSYANMDIDEKLTLIEQIRLSRVTPKKTSKAAKKKKKQVVVKKEKAQSKVMKSVAKMTPEMIEELMEALK